MKKLVFLAAVIVASLASCKKERTCTCTSTVGGSTFTASGTIKDTKKKAKEKCEEGNSTYVTCELE